MQLRTEGVLLSENDVLDVGIDELCFVETPDGVFLVASSGYGGGLASFRQTASGDWQFLDDAFFPGSATFGNLDLLGMAPTASGRMATIDADAGGMSGIVLRDDGTFGSQTSLSAQDAADLMRDPGTDDATLALLHRAGLSSDAIPAGLGESYGDVLTTTTVNGARFLLLADQGAHELSAVQLGTAPGSANLTSRMGQAQGLGIHTPTAIETVQIDGYAFVLLGAAGTSSLSVMRLTDEGTLILTDHLVDTLETRFGAVQALATAQVGDHVLVLAGAAITGSPCSACCPTGRWSGAIPWPTPWTPGCTTCRRWTCR